MPLYRCIVPPNVTTYEQRAEIAERVTRIHCDVTGGLPLFVHTFFAEDDAGMLPADKRALMLGSIRAGRTGEQKARLVAELAQSLARVLDLADENGVGRYGRRARTLGDGGRGHPARARRRGGLDREAHLLIAARSKL